MPCGKALIYDKRPRKARPSFPARKNSIHNTTCALYFRPYLNLVQPLWGARAARCPFRDPLVLVLLPLPRQWPKRVFVVFVYHVFPVRGPRSKHRISRDDGPREGSPLRELLGWIFRWPRAASVMIHNLLGEKSGDFVAELCIPCIYFVNVEGFARGIFFQVLVHYLRIVIDFDPLVPRHLAYYRGVKAIVYLKKVRRRSGAYCHWSKGFPSGERTGKERRY